MSPFTVYMGPPPPVTPLPPWNPPPQFTFTTGPNLLSVLAAIDALSKKLTALEAEIAAVKVLVAHKARRSRRVRP